MPKKSGEEPGPEEQEGEEEVSEEETGKLMFPTACIVRGLKNSFENQHQIKKEVKIGANKFLEEVLTDIAKRLDEMPYFTLQEDHFNRAIRRYKKMAVQEKRIAHLKKVLEAQRAELDKIIAEIEYEDMM